MSAPDNPFDQLERFFERMSEQYDEAAVTWETDAPFGELALGAESIAVDLLERGDEFVATIDLPGFEQEDVTVQVTDRTLRIDADRETTIGEEGDEEGDRYVHRERRRTTARREIRLPDDVRNEDVSARMENGVLTISLPREEAEEDHRIEIE